MALRDQLTTEYIKNFGLNNFEITNLAIEFMRSHIRSGHYITVEDALDMIRKRGPQDIIEELDEEIDLNKHS